tara:strand:+ start:257 stop:502 length:246 start_codon:yes stop_codon:yes gene_type:complete
MSKELSPSIIALHNEIKITLREAIDAIEKEGYKLKSVIDNEIDKTHLVKSRMTILNQKNKLIELDDLMRKVLIKEEELSIN